VTSLATGRRPSVQSYDTAPASIHSHQATGETWLCVVGTRVMGFRRYARRLRLWETNYGRDAGWVLERDGRPVAVLTDWRFEEMFWDSYRIEPIGDDPEERREILTNAFWDADKWIGVVWRNREFDEPPLAPFPAIQPIRDPGRVTVRALYIPIPGPWWWDRLVLWVRRACGRSHQAAVRS
jgi:hypothetical protein